MHPTISWSDNPIGMTNDVFIVSFDVGLYKKNCFAEHSCPTEVQQGTVLGLDRNYICA